ncbi:MAG TPA: hypothetical protein VGD55_12525 [Acidothermaceae bacterium]
MLASWAASPARFREDANAEEDLVLGGYRDRVLIELAQNAADAAGRAGVRGRLRFDLDSADAVLRASNTGAPIDAAGVESASTLRASSKRDQGSSGAVGRFGVGFAAVLAVTDEPSIVATEGSVTWSLDRLRDDVAAIPALAAEVARRGTALPILRLPYAGEGLRPGDGFDTEVVLPLRDATAVELVRSLLDDVDAVLLLTLPTLATVEIVIDGAARELHAVETADGLVVDGTRWIVHETNGRFDAELLRDRPVEERGRRDFVLTWAVPVDEAGAPVALPASVPGVVHAPTPTDEPLTLPALLVAPLPLDPTRRHVAPGPLRDALLDHAATAYADLVRGMSASAALLDLVPVSVAAGAIDGELRARILPALREVPFLSTAESSIRMRPANAVMLDDAGLASDDSLGVVLAPVLPELVPASWARRNPTALAALGVRRLPLGTLIDDLATVEREPAWWHSLYSALAGAGISSDVLSGVPVPLGSGGVARSARGLLMPGQFGDLTVLGLRTIHADAAHPLLLRLGAVEADPRAVLADDHVRAAVENSYDAAEPAEVADAILRLVAAANLQAGDEIWLAELALPADDGELFVAGELLMPQGKLAGVVADDAPFGTVDPALVERWGAQVLEAVGVLDSFAIVTDTDVVGADHDLDLEGEYLDSVRAVLAVDEPVVVSEFVGVRDLEFVRDDAWPAALALLSKPPLRATVVDRAVVIGGGLQARVPSYTAWWLRERRVVDGRLPASDPLLHGLFDVVGIEGDDEFLEAAGALRDLDDADHDEIAARLGDPARTVTRDQTRALYARLEPRDAPALVRAVLRNELAVVRAGDAVVVDAPDLLGLLGEFAIVPASLDDATRVADALDVALASELGRFEVASTGVPHDDHVVHDPLLVVAVGGETQRVAWRLADGVLHVDAQSLDFGLGRGRAWRDGQWSRRYVLSELLRGAVPSSVLLAEADLD